MLKQVLVHRTTNLWLVRIELVGKVLFGAMLRGMGKIYDEYRRLL